eukprot:gb/GECH01013461.1/.p1 GENE.gb/GECH01013461.1/~~gb/GECH01013461.1/.p1  ORF type:complete len:169 (+),score=28.69 gb/GECH01013461.1/:1-507(+)
MSFCGRYVSHSRLVATLRQTQSVSSRGASTDSIARKSTVAKSSNSKFSLNKTQHMKNSPSTQLRNLEGVNNSKPSLFNGITKTKPSLLDSMITGQEVVQKTSVPFHPRIPLPKTNVAAVREQLKNEEQSATQSLECTSVKRKRHLKIKKHKHKKHRKRLRHLRRQGKV